MESFSTKLKETSVHKFIKKVVSEILEELMLYFISIRAWVENLNITNCIKNLMVIMPSYFNKNVKDKN